MNSFGKNQNQKVVYSTWNEERSKEFPQVLKYRLDWQGLGYEVNLTANQDIRQDVEQLVLMTGLTSLLDVFDNLPTTNLQFDYWRYAMLYLHGGVYADVDVDPLPGIDQWQQKAASTESVVVFEESPTWMSHSLLLRVVRPLVSNYQEFPSYASCIVVAPTPKAPFFLDLLLAVDPEFWMNTKEPRRTLMMVGPGHLTRFAKTRSDVIVVSRTDAELAYEHNGFGTWKPPSTLLFEQMGPIIPVVMMGLLVALYAMAIRHRRNKRKFVSAPSKSFGGTVSQVDHCAMLPVFDKLDESRLTRRTSDA